MRVFLLFARGPATTFELFDKDTARPINIANALTFMRQKACKLLT
jgi:hypothetical protein